MDKTKNIQMPVEFLNEVARLLKALENENLSENALDLCNSIETLLIAKLERIKQREAFTAYKTASGDTREAKRIEYLQKAEISKDYISKKETH